MRSLLGRSVFVTYLWLLSAYPSVGIGIALNELLASNTRGVTDEDGEASDWIEIHNTSSEGIGLAGFGLTDDPSRPFRWSIPDVTVEAKGFLLIWASGKNRSGPALHTNFSLSKDGEEVQIYTPESFFVDGVSFGEQSPDVSFGRIVDGTGEWQPLLKPTPGESNFLRETASPPECSPDGGFYSTPQWVVLSNPEEGGEIRFTRDGSIPGLGSLQYTGPFYIEATTLLRARFFAPGKDPSAVLTRSFLFEDPGSVASISLVTSPENLWDTSTGIYVNSLEQGVEWERPVSIEFFPNGADGFRIHAGVRIHGGIGRNFEKKSFRFYFSNAYGPPRLEYPLFPNNGVQSFKSLVLSSGSNDSNADTREVYTEVWTLLRDRVMTTLFRSIGTQLPHQRPVRLFLNGQPWGLYWLKERIDEHFVENHFGLHDFDLLKHEHGLAVEEGDADNWNEMLRFLETSDPIGAASYERIGRWMDLDNFIDHYILEMWAINLDWPHNNNYQYRPRVPTGVWRWIPWDTDHTMGSPNIIAYDWNTYPHVSGDHELEQDWSTIHFQKLHDHPDFRVRFINRIGDLLNTVLKPSAVRNVIDSAASEIQNDIPFETSRWGSTLPEWRNHVEKLRQFTGQRNPQFLAHTESFFGPIGQFRLTLQAPVGEGSVRVNRLEIDRFPWTGLYFKTIPVPLVALPAPGYRFAGWQGGGLPDRDSVSIVSQNDLQIRPVFVPVPTATPTPTVAPTPTATFLHPFDWDESGMVDDADLLRMIEEFRDPGADPRGDFNGNGKIDSSDFLTFISQYKTRTGGSSR
jgi:hypothetical protein